MTLRSPNGARLVLAGMSEGKTNAQIGREFGVTHHAIEKYLFEVVYPMVGCESPTAQTRRAEAVGRAYRLGIL